MTFGCGDCKKRVGYFATEVQKRSSPKIYGLYKIYDKLYSVKYMNFKVGECLLSFGADAFVFPFVIKKLKD